MKLRKFIAIGALCLASLLTMPAAMAMPSAELCLTEPIQFDIASQSLTGATVECVVDQSIDLIADLSPPGAFGDNTICSQDQTHQFGIAVLSSDRIDPGRCSFPA